MQDGVPFLGMGLTGSSIEIGSEKLVEGRGAEIISITRKQVDISNTLAGILRRKLDLEGLVGQST